MSRELVLHDTATEFLLNTCRPCQRSKSKTSVRAAALCSERATSLTNDVDIKFIPLATGSVAEFYIERILPHVNDIDMMYHYNIHLAIPRGHPPPTQLPAEFHNYVQVVEIIDSHLPGYVYLELRYLLIECSDDDHGVDDNYNAIEYDRGLYASNETNVDLAEIHAPAIVTRPGISSTLLPLDVVRCIRCLSWPPQAADWPTRHRKYGWPDSTTLDRVVSNGCDVVGVAHHQCRQHELMGMLQHRLSFSRAEIVLINSWMPVQQIVYHMLRYFVKTTQLADSTDNTAARKLSNYHIKTLMFWACELKSRCWWTNDVNLVRMCVQLLHNLAEWLTAGWCQHYFINNCNLVDDSFNVTNIRGQLMSLDQPWLSTWFEANYIRACLQLSDCPRNISRLFDDVTTSMKLRNAVSALVTWRRKSSDLHLWRALDSAESIITSRLYRHPLSARSCVWWMTELTKVDSCLSVYSSSVSTCCVHNTPHH